MNEQTEQTEPKQYSLYALSEHDSDVDVQRPTYMLVRVTDSTAALDRSVVRIQVSEHGGVTVAVREGVVVTTLDI